MGKIPKSFHEAQKRLEDDYEKATISSTDTLIVRDGDHYIEFDNSGRWAWEYQGDENLRIEEDSGEFDPDNVARTFFITKVEKYFE